MSNRWGITEEVEKFVKQRDVECVYCGVRFTEAKVSRKNKPSWEHIVNDNGSSPIEDYKVFLEFEREILDLSDTNEKSSVIQFLSSHARVPD